MELELCPICCVGHLHEQPFTTTITREGQQVDVELLHGICDHCQSEVAGEGHASFNKRAVQLASSGK